MPSDRQAQSGQPHHRDRINKCDDGASQAQSRAAAGFFLAGTDQTSAGNQSEPAATKQRHNANPNNNARDKSARKHQATRPQQSSSNVSVSANLNDQPAHPYQ